jgi:hypothetical protein
MTDDLLDNIYFVRKVIKLPINLGMLVVNTKVISSFYIEISLCTKKNPHLYCKRQGLFCYIYYYGLAKFA